MIVNNGGFYLEIGCFTGCITSIVNRIRRESLCFTASDQPAVSRLGNPALDRNYFLTQEGGIKFEK